MDLALLAVDKAAIPSLQLWLNPLCRSVVPVGAPVIVVYPDRTIPSRTVSPQLIAPKYRAKFDTLISEPEVSGSGLYDLQKRCLLGIMSAAIVTAGLGPGLSRVGYFYPPPRLAPSSQLSLARKPVAFDTLGATTPTQSHLNADPLKTTSRA